MGNEKYIQQLDNISPNLKLSGKHILPVLEQISRGEPDRDKIARFVVTEVFPDKSEKSVFRGMVVPTMTKLHFARKDTPKKTFSLSPNGRACTYSRNEQLNRDRVGHMIRDYSAIEIGLVKEAVDYLVKYRNELQKNNPKLENKAIRFYNQYLDKFHVELPSEAAIGDGVLTALYQKSGLDLYIDEAETRRQWIKRCFKTRQIYQIDEARWRLIKVMLDQGNTVSTWFVDEAMWREMRSSNRIIDLWEASTVADTKLKRGNSTYEALVLRGTDNE